MCDDQQLEEATSHSLKQQTSGIRAEAIQWMQDDICDVCDACLHEVADICPESQVPARSYNEDSMSWIPRPADEDWIFVHHRTLDSLESSIRGGCHFCIALWNYAYPGGRVNDVEVVAEFERDVAAMKRLLRSSRQRSMRIATDVRVDDIVSTWVVLPGEDGIRIDSLWLDCMAKELNLEGRSYYLHHYKPIFLNPSIAPGGLRMEDDARSQGLTTGSDPSIKALLNWLHDCQAHQDSCVFEEDWCPTRLVQLEANRAFRVIETSGSTRLLGPYCTLSYCWGSSSHRLLLTRESEQRLKAGASLDELPKVLQDAAQVCTALGVQYLWIDSLCIMQDQDLGDWERESQLMHKVYSNGYLNISATASSSPDQGLFRRRRLRARVIIRHRTSLFEPGLYFQSSGLDFARQEMEWTPLQRRAWALQERLLAPRNAHFGLNEIFWECNSVVSCESYARVSEDCIPVCTENYAGAGHECTSACRDDVLPRVRALHNNTESTTKRDLRDDWLNIQSRYADMDISYHKDRPVAIAGLAALFETLLDDQYLYGLWAGDFRQGLMWCPGGPVRHEARLEAVPSWSWLSASSSHIHGSREWLLFSVVESEAELRALAACTSPPYVHLKGKMGSAEIHDFTGNDSIERVKVLIGAQEVDFRLDRPLRGDETASSTLEGCQWFYMLAAETVSKFGDGLDGLHIDFFLFECTSSVSEKGKAVFRRLALSHERALHQRWADSFQVPEGAGHIPSDSYDPETGEHVICVA